jgi:hypothetical protein
VFIDGAIENLNLEVLKITGGIDGFYTLIFENSVCKEMNFTFGMLSRKPLLIQTVYLMWEVFYLH